MTERVNCPTCPCRDVTEAHIGRCEVLTRERTSAVEHGRRYDVPDVTTADLWAHLGHVSGPHDATRIVRQVLDLGWRPVVGKDGDRLWSPTTTERPAAEAVGESESSE